MGLRAVRAPTASCRSMERGCAELGFRRRGRADLSDGVQGRLGSGLPKHPVLVPNASPGRLLDAAEETLAVNADLHRTEAGMGEHISHLVW